MRLYIGVMEYWGNVISNGPYYSESSFGRLPRPQGEILKTISLRPDGRSG